MQRRFQRLREHLCVVAISTLKGMKTTLKTDLPREALPSPAEDHWVSPGLNLAAATTPDRKRTTGSESRARCSP